MEDFMENPSVFVPLSEETAKSHKYEYFTYDDMSEIMGVSRAAEQARKEERSNILLRLLELRERYDNDPMLDPFIEELRGKK